MERRDFLHSLFAASVLLPTLAQCRKEETLEVKAKENASGLSHRLLDKDFPPPTETKETDVLIIGAGVSGLTAGYHFFKQGLEKFELIEVGNQYGGNAASGQNNYTKHPWAAHYLPIANNDNAPLLSFLQDAGVIIRYEKGLPVYKEEYLNFTPQEALFIHKNWQEGLLPYATLNKKELDQNKRFLALMQDYKLSKGQDDRFFFTIPLSFRSTDPSLHFLDTSTFSDFLSGHGFDSPFLDWYVNYCCKDEYGAPASKVSAWAGIHYFASRRAKGANCSENHYLVWPQGNGFLVDALAKPITAHIRLRHVCFDIEEKEGIVKALVYDEAQNKTICYLAKKCVISTPLFVTKRLLPEILGPEALTFISQLHYYPWLTANVVFKKIKSSSPAWDNVFYTSPSLGLVYAQHQSLHQYQAKKTFTYYRNFSEKNAREERYSLYHSSEQEIISMILKDIKDFYSEKEDIESIHYNLIGHGMISPLKEIITHPFLERLKKPFGKSIYLAHSDLSGYSIFEEAFDHGTRVSQEILTSWET